jgi:adenosylhomocysteine nucleosidase
LPEFPPGKVLVLISANIEWRAIRRLFRGLSVHSSPYGEWFIEEIRLDGSESLPLVFFHGGWGKIAAAASTQYVIDRWSPGLLINLGTCGGFEGEIERGEVVLVEKTIVYDIIEQMGDYDEHIAHYSTSLDVDWASAGPPIAVRRGLLVSADRDLVVEQIPELKRKYGARAGDWESGAIAYVANRNAVRLLILRGVTDLVGSGGGEAYGNLELFAQKAEEILAILVDSLPGWLRLAQKAGFLGEVPEG